jgi:hypothetical protein
MKDGERQLLIIAFYIGHALRGDPFSGTYVTAPRAACR